MRADPGTGPGSDGPDVAISGVPEVRDVPLRWILEQVAPAYGGTWDEVGADMLADPVEARTVELLVDDLVRDRSFHTPVVILDRTVANGMHRIVAAAICDMATIRAVTAPWPYDLPEFELTLDATGDVDDVFDVAARALRSFPVADVWVEGSLAGVNDTLFLDLSCPEHLVGAVPEAVRDQGGRFGLDVTVTRIAAVADE